MLSFWPILVLFIISSSQTLVKFIALIQSTCGLLTPPIAHKAVAMWPHLILQKPFTGRNQPKNFTGTLAYPHSLLCPIPSDSLFESTNNKHSLLCECVFCYGITDWFTNNDLTSKTSREKISATHEDLNFMILAQQQLSWNTHKMKWVASMNCERLLESTVEQTRGYSMNEAQQNQAFFARSGTTKPKATVRDDGYHKGGYQLSLSTQAFCLRHCAFT